MLLRQGGGMIYRFAPPVMLLRYKNFKRNPLRSAAPPTPEQPDFASANPHISRPGGTRNPSVLLSPEMVCSVRQHPLSGDSGRKRYNTLDFARQNRVPTGRFHPYWKPRIKGICHPFEIPARFEICIYKPEKRCLHLHIPKRKNPHSRSSDKERKDCGDFQCRIHRNGRYSCVMHRCGDAIFGTLTRVPEKER